MPPDKPILDRDSDDDSVSSLALSELEITPSRSRANVFDPGSSSLGAELKLRDYPRSDIVSCTRLHFEHVIFTSFSNRPLNYFCLSISLHQSRQGHS